MKLQILQENLQKAINITSRFVSPKAQLPILGNILLLAEKTKIYISSTNLEISASVSVGAKIDEVGEISIPAKVITELVANLPKETITLESEKEQLKITAPGFFSMVLGMDSTDFPKIPRSINKTSAVSLPQKVFTDALSQVIFSTSVDETRPILTGVLLIFNKSGISLVATDGFRLSIKDFPFKMPSGSVKRVVIPKGVLNELSRLNEEEIGEILFDLQDKDKQAVFGLGDVILTSRLLEGEYPDYEKIIPKSSNIKILTDKEELSRAIKLASIFARESANIVKIKVLSDKLKIFAESSAAGSQETKVDAKVEGEMGKEFEIAFNYRFLEDFLHSVKGEEVKLEFTGVSSPGIFRDTSDAEYLHLIMPVKTQG